MRSRGADRQILRVSQLYNGGDTTHLRKNQSITIAFHSVGPKRVNQYYDCL